MLAPLNRALAVNVMYVEGSLVYPAAALTSPSEQLVTCVAYLVLVSCCFGYRNGR